MGCFRGLGGARNVLMASSCVVLVFFMLPAVATSVTAGLLENVPPSASSPVQKSSYADEDPALREIAGALREIAGALTKIVELLSNKWTKLFALVLLFVRIFPDTVALVLAKYLAIRLGLTRRQQDPVADPRAEQVDGGENQTNSEGDVVDEALRNANMDPFRRDNPRPLPPLEPEASAEKDKEAHIEERGHDCSI